MTRHSFYCTRRVICIAKFSIAKHNYFPCFYTGALSTRYLIIFAPVASEKAVVIWWKVVYVLFLCSLQGTCNNYTPAFEFDDSIPIPFGRKRIVTLAR